MPKTLLNNETIFRTICKCDFYIILPSFCKLKFLLKRKIIVRDIGQNPYPYQHKCELNYLNLYLIDFLCNIDESIHSSVKLLIYFLLYEIYV